MVKYVDGLFVLLLWLEKNKKNLKKAKEAKEAKESKKMRKKEKKKEEMKGKPKRKNAEKKKSCLSEKMVIEKDSNNKISKNGENNDQNINANKNIDVGQEIFDDISDMNNQQGKKANQYMNFNAQIEDKFSNNSYLAFFYDDKSQYTGNDSDIEMEDLQRPNSPKGANSYIVDIENDNSQNPLIINNQDNSNASVNEVGQLANPYSLTQINDKKTSNAIEVNVPKNTSDEYSKGILNNIIQDENERNLAKMRQEILNIKNINDSFNEEIMNYIRTIIPINDSLEYRVAVFENIKSIMKEYKELSKVYLYGSFGQNISTVNSDIDLMIQCYDCFGKKYTQKEEKKCLKIINNYLKYKKPPEIKNLFLIDTAIVPIITGTYEIKKTKIRFDITANRYDGPKVAYVIRKIIKEYKILRPTILILKVMLQKKKLYSTKTGGMSSFLLFHLVYFFYIIYLQRIKEGYYNKVDMTNLNVNGANNKSRYIVKEKYFSTKENSSETSILLSNIFFQSEKEIKLLINIEKNNLIKYNDFIIPIEEEDCNFVKESFSDLGNKENYSNVAHFLIAFLKYYAREFDNENMVLSLNSERFGQKLYMEKGVKINGIWVESIQEERVNVGEKCQKYNQIKALFEKAYTNIEAKSKEDSPSIIKALELSEN